MTRRLAALIALLSAGLVGALLAAPAQGAEVRLPGIRYQVLAAGPASGAHPSRADSVSMRYVGRLGDGPGKGEVFSTSPDDGKGLSTFPVNGVIPGMSAALQLMRPGDHWKITMPPYLAYGPGRPLNTPPPPLPGGGAVAAAQVTQKRGIPPNATLVFDVELVAILPAKTQ